MAHALVFDMDGVLADTEALIAQATIEMYRELYHIEFRPRDFLPFVGTGAVRYTQGPAEVAGIDIDLDRALAVRYANFVRLLHSGADISFAGVGELIAAAAAAPDWKLAIATSSPELKARDTLDAARICLDDFDAFITGDHVTHKKPHPEIYLAAAAALDLPPAACVVVEDAVAGVDAAKAAGMYCVAVTNTFTAAELDRADWTVDTLTAVSLPALRQRLDGVRSPA